MSETTESRDYYQEFEDRFGNLETHDEVIRAIKKIKNEDDRNQFLSIEEQYAVDRFASFEYDCRPYDDYLIKLMQKTGIHEFYVDTLVAINNNDYKKAIQYLIDDFGKRDKSLLDSLNTEQLTYYWSSVFKNACPGFYGTLAKMLSDYGADESVTDLCNALEVWFYSENKTEREDVVHHLYQKYPDDRAVQELEAVQDFIEEKWRRAHSILKTFGDENEATMFSHDFLNMLKERTEQFPKIERMMQGKKSNKSPSYRHSEKSYYIQAHISNLSFLPDADSINFNTDNACDLLTGGTKSHWSAPKWGHTGDIILFDYSKESPVNNMNATAKKLESSPTSERVKEIDRIILSHSRKIHKYYGSKIIAVGRLASDSKYEKGSGWHYMADIKDIVILDHPLEVSSFRSFQQIMQNGVTPLWGDHYQRIKDMIIEKNPNLPEYFLDSLAMTEDQSSINSENWIEKNLENHRHYHKEEEYRTFFIDNLLRSISDDGKFYEECNCYREGAAYPSKADYVISFNGKWLPVEAKINIFGERDLNAQVHKYCNLVRLELDSESAADPSDFVNDHVLIIDEERIEMYDDQSDSRTELMKLDDLRQMADIDRLVKIISDNL